MVKPAAFQALRLALLGLIATMVLSGAPQQGAVPLFHGIRGVVTEPETDQPVVDAEIALFTQVPGPARINGGWVADPSRSARTDNSGAFALKLDQPGSYRIQAKKAGYGAIAGGVPDSFEATLTAEDPAAETGLFLSRVCAIAGRVVDDTTHKPIPDMRVMAVRVRAAGVPAPTKTDAGGHFVAENLPPGDYTVEIDRQTEEAARVLTTFTEADAEKIDLDYEQTYWPGGHGPETARPVTIADGGLVDIGTLPVRKVEYYRVHVRIPVSSCEAGDTISIREGIVRSRGMNIYPLTQSPCGQDLLVTGFSPGTYRLILSIAGRELQNSATALIPFSIVNRNIAITAPLTAGVTLDGAIVSADGAEPPDFTKIAISLIPSAEGPTTYTREDRSTPGADGRFQMSSVHPLAQTLRIDGLDAGHYVEEIRYNGISLPDGILPLDQAAATHTLTIVVNDKAGMIAGSVAGVDGPVSKPLVIAMKWPFTRTSFMGPSAFGRAQGDANGNFRMTGLAPGEYRVLALRALPSQSANLTLESMEATFAAAKKVEVGPGGFQNVILAPAEVP